jgi:hypothetical protein
MSGSAAAAAADQSSGCTLGGDAGAACGVPGKTNNTNATTTAKAEHGRTELSLTQRTDLEPPTPRASRLRTQIHGCEYVITICNIYAFEKLDAAGKISVPAFDAAAYRIK